jgi:hypothetical protein
LSICRDVDFSLWNEEHRFLSPSIVNQPRKHAGRARIIYLPEARRLLNPHSKEKLAMILSE